MLNIDSVLYEQCCLCRILFPIQDMEWVEEEKGYADSDCLDMLQNW